MAVLEGDTSLLKEMKKVNSGGGGQADLPDNVDGANGSEEIVEKFSEVYSTLYNSAESKKGMSELKERITSMLKPTDIDEVSKVTS